MYVDVSTVRANGKSYTRTLLRESYRERGKVKHRTIANLSQCSAEEIQALRLALRHKAQLAEMIQSGSGDAKPTVRPAKAEKVELPPFQLRQDKSIGAVWLLAELATELGISQALGDDRAGRLALWQVLARTIDQGSSCTS